ncbi:MAG: efflux RND transporter periplasmic adaptor subunit [Luteibaculaceae bacterium]
MCKTAFVVSTIISVAFSLVSCDDGSDKNKSNGPAAPRALSVDAVVVENSFIENKINAVGSLLPFEQVVVKSEVAGRVVELNFAEGSTVKKGDILVRLNADELEAERKKLKVELSLAEKELYRRKELIKLKGISQEELDVAENRVEFVKADIALNESRLDKTRIVAPFSGQIGLRSISMGAYLSPDSEVAVLRQVDKLKLEFSVPEIYSNKLEVGQVVHFKVSGYNREFNGEVYAVEPGIDVATRSLKVRAVVPNQSSRLLPGSFANVVLVLEGIKDAKMLPTNSLVPEMSSQSVWLVKDGKVTKQMVSTGIRTESEIQITEGLSVGDTVLTTGILQAREGSKVKVTLK